MSTSGEKMPSLVCVWHLFLQPDVHPGNCWAFSGSSGFLVIRLSMTILPTAFTLEHIPKALAPHGTLHSAPQDFSVYVRERLRVSWLHFLTISAEVWRRSVFCFRVWTMRVRRKGRCSARTRMTRTETICRRTLSLWVIALCGPFPRTELISSLLTARDCVASRILGPLSTVYAASLQQPPAFTSSSLLRRQLMIQMKLEVSDVHQWRSNLLSLNWWCLCSGRRRLNEPSRSLRSRFCPTGVTRTTPAFTGSECTGRPVTAECSVLCRRTIVWFLV